VFPPITLPLFPIPQSSISRRRKSSLRGFVVGAELEGTHMMSQKS
jgi:hypothetical protein